MSEEKIVFPGNSLGGDYSFTADAMPTDNFEQRPDEQVHSHRQTSSPRRGARYPATRRGRNGSDGRSSSPSHSRFYENGSVPSFSSDTARTDREPRFDNRSAASDDYFPSISNDEMGIRVPFETDNAEDGNRNQGPAKKIYMSHLRALSLEELMKMAKARGIMDTNRMPKQDIICAILCQAANFNETIYGDGVLEFVGENFGFLRSMSYNYVSSPDDIYVSQNQIKRFNLCSGDVIAGQVKAPKRSERYFSLAKIDTVNDHPLEEIGNKVNFVDLVPLYPKEKFNLDVSNVRHGSQDYSTRIIDLIAPIGKGQRALIVAPPRSGKTILMQNIAHAINVNHPEVYLIVLLIDERPEEVTDMQMSIKGEVVSSTFDEPASRHIALAEIVLAKAKRQTEEGKDVVILLDNLTRLARAYNAAIPSSGKVLTGGVDSNALQRPKRFLGAARNTKNGGSLTIIATALVDTGSRMDEVIFEEFKGTGNSEIVLDRKLSERRIFPAIDVIKSGTRREEEMVDEKTSQRLSMLRRILVMKAGESGNNIGAMEFLVKKVKDSDNNQSFLENMNT